METLKQIILAETPMTVDRYMELCLTHPVHGYYMKQDPFGANGDFTTAPEISQIFGEIIGVWCVTKWEQAGKPEKFALMELGPGRGTLMSDLLRGVKHIHGFKPEIHLVEISPVLRAAQREKLPQAIWHNEIPQLKIPTIVIANEFFDALPIKQFIGDKERMIIANGDNLAFNMPADEGTVHEICPAARDIMAKISENMAGIIIDYGYRERRKADSLQAMRQHKFVSPLDNPGDADLTAHVDFAALINYSKKITNFYTQREFLLGHGADLRAKMLKKESDLARLIEPAQMGELFKVLCF